jgi:hypothetical protein
MTAGRLLYALAALIVCAELLGTVLYLTSTGSEQVVEASPVQPPPPRLFQQAR